MGFWRATKSSYEDEREYPVTTGNSEPFEGGEGTTLVITLVQKPPMVKPATR